MGKSNIINNQNERSRDRISKALMVLERGSISEARKETDFLETLNRDLNGSGLEPLPDITEDPFGFINSLNTLLLGENDYKNALMTERKRIKEYKEAVRLYGDSNKKIHQAISKGLIDSSILHNTANTIEGLNSGGKKGHSAFTTYSALGSKRSLAGEISEAVMYKIFSEYLDRIIDFSNDEEVVINGSQLAAISALATSEIEKRFLNSSEGKEITKKNIGDITKAIIESDAYNDIIEALTSSSAEALTTLDSFSKDAYNQEKANSLMKKKNFKRTAAYRNPVSRIQKGLKDSKSFGSLSDQTLKKLYTIAGEAGALSATINVSAYFHSEASLASLTSKHLGVLFTGKIAKDDLGMMYFDMKGDIRYKKETLEKMQQQILKNEFKGKAEHFQKNYENMVELGQMMEQELEEMAKKGEKTYEELKKINRGFIIHGNVKSYDTINTKTSDFSGGSIGSNITEQLTAFSQMLNAAGFGNTNYDSAWLLGAIINSGSGLIGEGNKEGIEKYFASMASMLLFDDALLIVSDGVNDIEESMTGGLSHLHLYSLNGILVPSSYILSETYKSLDNFFNQAYATQISENGVKATITARGADGGPFSHPEDWESEKAAALEAANIEITFMGGFLGFLDNLYNAINLK